MPGLPRSEMVFLRAIYPRLRPRDRRSPLLHRIEVRVHSISSLPKSCCTGRPWWLDPVTESIILRVSRLDWLPGNESLRRPTPHLLELLPGAGGPPAGAVHQLLPGVLQAVGPPPPGGPLDPQDIMPTPGAADISQWRSDLPADVLPQESLLGCGRERHRCPPRRRT